MMSSVHFAPELVRQRIDDLVTETRGRGTPAWAQAPLAERASRTFATAAVLRRLADRLDPPCESNPALASGTPRPR
jgi:hypothetical protein